MYVRIILMSKLLGLFLVGILVFMPVVTTAVSGGGINILDVKLTLKERTLQAVFSVENSSQTQQSIIYGIRLQSPDGGDVYEDTVGEITLQAGKSNIEHANIDIPITISGIREVFLISRNPQGLVTALKYAGEVDIKKPVVSTESQDSPNMYIPIVLNNCNLSEDNLNIKCSVTGLSDNINIRYVIHKGSIYTPIIKKGVFNNIEIIDGEVIIPIKDDLPSGDYTYRLRTSDRGVSINVVVNIDNGDILEDPYLQDGENVNDGINHLNGSTYAKIAIIILPILALIVLLYVALRRPKTLMVIIIGSGLAVSGVAMASITLNDLNPSAHIFSGLSQDSGKEHFLIVLNNSNSEFQTTEDIRFSIVFENTALPNNKPSGGSIEARVGNSGPWHTIITAVDSGTLYSERLSPIATIGTHSLNFRSPDLCGGVFGLSLFNFGIFGTTDCLFSIGLTVVQNDPPSTPTIGGNCILGEPCSIGIESTDSDGGILCYEAQWPNGISQSAGCATQDTPVSVIYTFNSCDVAGTTVRAQATDSSGEKSLWGIASGITCIEPCPHCTYNGTVGDISLSAQPSFLPSSGIVNVSWNLTNIATCSMESINIADSTPRGGPWNWDFIRLNSNMYSVVLDGATRYTMTCTDLNGNELNSSATIIRLPQWQEF